MGELALDQERLRRAGGLSGREDERPGAGNRDAAWLLEHVRQGEGTLGQLLDPAQVRRLVIELRVRIGRRGARPRAGAHGERRSDSGSLGKRKLRKNPRACLRDRAVISVVASQGASGCRPRNESRSMAQMDSIQLAGTVVN